MPSGILRKTVLFASIMFAVTLYGFRASLFIGARRLFASGQIPIGKIFGGYLQVATLKSSCIVPFAWLLKIHPIK